MSANGKTAQEDLSPSLLKLGIVPDGFVIQNVTGIRTHIVRRLDGKGYDIRKRAILAHMSSTLGAERFSLVGHYSVRTGHIVYINDSTIFPQSHGVQEAMLRTDVLLRVYMDDVDPMFAIPGFDTSNELNALLTGYTAYFGGNIWTDMLSRGDNKTLRLTRADGVAVHRDFNNFDGCARYKYSYPDSVLVVHRGGCTFLEKLLQANAASAAGVLVISNDDFVINPTANPDELEAAGDLSGVAFVLLPQKAGRALEDILDRAEQVGTQVMLAMEDESRQIPPAQTHPPPEKDPNRILYINGHPLINTRLLV